MKRTLIKSILEKQKESKFQERFLWYLKEEGQHWEVACAVRWECHAASHTQCASLSNLHWKECFRLFNDSLLSALLHIIYNSALNPYIHIHIYLQISS